MSRKCALIILGVIAAVLTILVWIGCLSDSDAIKSACFGTGMIVTLGGMVLAIILDVIK